MIYCLHHYNIPLLWRWQLHSCKSCDLLQRRLGFPQPAGKWYLHLKYSQHHLRRPNHPGSRWVVGTEWRDWEVRLLGDHWELLTLALVPAVPCQAPQASWCCTNSTARAGTSTGCWLESYTCSEASRGVRGLCIWVRSACTHLGDRNTLASLCWTSACWNHKEDMSLFSYLFLKLGEEEVSYLHFPYINLALL